MVSNPSFMSAFFDLRSVSFVGGEVAHTTEDWDRINHKDRVRPLSFENVAIDNERVWKAYDSVDKNGKPVYNDPIGYTGQSKYHTQQDHKIRPWCRVKVDGVEYLYVLSNRSGVFMARGFDCLKYGMTAEEGRGAFREAIDAWARNERPPSFVVKGPMYFGPGDLRGGDLTTAVFGAKLPRATFMDTPRKRFFYIDPVTTNLRMLDFKRLRGVGTCSPRLYLGKNDHPLASGLFMPVKKGKQRSERQQTRYDRSVSTSPSLVPSSVVEHIHGSGINGGRILRTLCYLRRVAKSTSGLIDISVRQLDGLDLTGDIHLNTLYTHIAVLKRLGYIRKQDGKLFLPSLWKLIGAQEGQDVEYERLDPTWEDWTPRLNNILFTRATGHHAMMDTLQVGFAVKEAPAVNPELKKRLTLIENAVKVFNQYSLKTTGNYPGHIDTLEYLERALPAGLEIGTTVKSVNRLVGIFSEQKTSVRMAAANYDSALNGFSYSGVYRARSFHQEDRVRGAENLLQAIRKRVDGLHRPGSAQCVSIARHNSRPTEDGLDIDRHNTYMENAYASGTISLHEYSHASRGAKGTDVVNHVSVIVSRRSPLRTISAGKSPSIHHYLGRPTSSASLNNDRKHDVTSIVSYDSGHGPERKAHDARCSHSNLARSGSKKDVPTAPTVRRQRIRRPSPLVFNNTVGGRTSPTKAVALT